MVTFKKKSDTSIRVLETLKLLSRKDVSAKEIINHFEKINPENGVYTNEAILKYINTLKVFGFKFKKEKGKYILLNAPPKFDFDETELIGLKLLEKLASSFPEEDVKNHTLEFLHDIGHRFSDATILLTNNIKKPNIKDLQFNYKKNQETIKKLEKYCADKQKLKITYRTQQDEISTTFEPIEINYINNNVYFSVYNPSSAQIHDIKANNIIKIEQLPLKSNPTTMTSSVTFQLKDRLAKAYKIKDNERLLNTNSDESIIIINQNEDRTLLLKRLMRYGKNCEVISPKSLREEMRQMIKLTIGNYD